uniref:Sialidase-like n=1 Tax=Cicer arietinum TaxID=3827 RepID=A0A1S3DWW1_CICAR|nr:sialidase-like [Cicer arietinum]
MARIKMTAKRKISYQEPEENQDVYSSTESDYHEENQSEATSMNTISSSQPSKSSYPSITPKIVIKSSSSTPSRRSSRIMSGAVSSNKAPPQDNTIHVINSDDSETTPPTEPSQQPPHMKIQNDDRPASKKRKTRHSSVSQNTEDETPHPPPEDTPSPLIPEPTSPLRNSLETTPSPASLVPTITQSSPIHKLTPFREADPIPEDASKSTSPQHMEDGDELYFDLNLSYPPSPTDVPMASPPTVPVDEDVLPPPDLSKDQKKILQRFTHFQNSLVQFGLILEWVTKHLVPTVAPGYHPLELPSQPTSHVPSPSSSSDEPASSD